MGWLRDAFGHPLSNILHDAEIASDFLTRGASTVLGVAADITEALPFVSEVAAAAGFTGAAATAAEGAAGFTALGEYAVPAAVAVGAAKGFTWMELATGVSSGKMRELEDNLYKDTELPVDTIDVVPEPEQPPDLTNVTPEPTIQEGNLVSDHAKNLVEAGRADPGTQYPQIFSWTDDDGVHTVEYTMDKSSEHVNPNPHMTTPNPSTSYTPGTNPGNGHIYRPAVMPRGQLNLPHHLDLSSGAELIHFPDITSHDKKSFVSNDIDSYGNHIPIQPISMGGALSGVDIYDSPYGYIQYGAPMPTDYGPPDFDGLNSAELY